jgi:hypothetical protein
LRELSYTANFVYTTVSKVYTALLSKPESFFKILGFFHKLTDFWPDSALGIMIALMYSVARL